MTWCGVGGVEAGFAGVAREVMSSSSWIEQVDEANINDISLNINRLQHLDNKLFGARAQKEYDMQVNASRGLPIVLASI